jgi:flagellar protein FliT
MNCHAETQVMAYYESIGHVTRLMLRAAEEQDWEMLIDAEACCARLIDGLQAITDDTTALPPEDTRRKHEIILKILADDAQIRLLTQPWLRKLDGLLGCQVQERRSEGAYRS